MPSCSLLLALISSTWAIAACGESPCPQSTVRVGNSCRARADAGAEVDAGNGADGGVPDQDASTDESAVKAVCGDGSVHRGELCDDGALLDGDGCSSQCKVEASWSCSIAKSASDCAQIPATPVVVGAASAAPESVVWQWNIPERTTSFELNFDGTNASTQSATEPAQLIRLNLAEGMHTLEVRACNRIGGCSEWASARTKVERFGQGYSAVLAGTARTLALTPIGHGAAIACNDCFLAQGGSALPLADTLSSLGTGLLRGADVLDLDVVRVGETLYLAHLDSATAVGLIPLASVLSDARLQNSDALLAFEVVEDDSDPNAFARSLLALLDSHSLIVRNGRPLLLRARDNRLKFLDAIWHEAGADHPLVSPYLRYLVDDLNPQTPSASFSFVHGLLFDFRTPNLFKRLGEARAKHLGTGVFNVPGPGHGEIVMAALRDEVDLFLTDYRAEEAKQVLRDQADGAYVNSRAQIAGMPLTVQRVESGQVTVLSRGLNLAPSATFGTPRLMSFIPPFGGVLDFWTGDRALSLSDTPIQGAAKGGILVSSMVVLPDLSSIAQNERRTLLSSGDSKGFTLALTRGSGTDIQLSFSVNVAGMDRIHSYPAAGGSGTACSSKNGSFVEALVPDRAYWLVGAYDGDGQILLFIDGRCAGSVPVSATGAITNATSPPLLGATPDATASLKARAFFQGFAQHAQVLQWLSRDQDLPN